MKQGIAKVIITVATVTGVTKPTREKRRKKIHTKDGN